MLPSERAIPAPRLPPALVRHTRYLGAAHGYVATGDLTPQTSLEAVAEVAAFLRAM